MLKDELNTEFIDFIKNNDTRFVASKLLRVQSKSVTPHNASDYDVFCALCDSLYLLAGHPMRERFLKLLSSYSLSEIFVDMLYNGEYQKRLWQKIFVDGNIVLPSYKSVFNLKSMPEKKIDDKFFCINSAIDSSCENIYTLLDKLLGKIKDSAANVICFDTRNISFTRPDDFHAQRAYDSIKLGDSDFSMLSLWLMCRILMNTDLQLRLTVKNIKMADDILTMIFRLGLSPKIIISIDASKCEEYSKIYELLKNYGQKNISLELYSAKENINMLIDFLYKVPLMFVKAIDIPEECIKYLLNDRVTEQELELITSHLYTAK
jgi:hypothetical protein